MDDARRRGLQEQFRAVRGVHLVVELGRADGLLFARNLAPLVRHARGPDFLVIDRGEERLPVEPFGGDERVDQPPGGRDRVGRVEQVREGPHGRVAGHVEGEQVAAFENYHYRLARVPPPCLVSQGDASIETPHPLG